MTQSQPSDDRIRVGGANVSRATVRYSARIALGWAVLGLAAMLLFGAFVLPRLGETMELDIPGRGPDTDFAVSSVGTTVVGLIVTAVALLAAIAAVLVSRSAPGPSYITAAVVAIVIPGFAALILGNGLAALEPSSASGSNLAVTLTGILAFAAGAFSLFGAMKLAGDKESLG